MSVRIMLIVLSYSQNGYSKYFSCTYDCDPEGLLVALVHRKCNGSNNGDSLVEEDGHEVDVSVGCKAEGKSISATP